MVDNSEKIYIDYNVDDKNELFSIHIIEYKKVPITQNFVTLKQIPDKEEGIVLLYPDDMIRVDNVDEIYKQNQYYISYPERRIYVHPDLQGQSIKVEYYGLGKSLINADQIVLVSQDGMKQEIIQDLIDKREAQFKLISSLGDSCEVILKLNTSIENGENLYSLLTDIVAKGLPLSEELTNNIKTATPLNQALVKNIPKAETINTNLTNTTNNAVTAKTNLDKSVADSKAHVEIIQKTDHQEVTISNQSWNEVDSNGFYSYKITHTLKSEKLIIAMVDENKNSMAFSYQIIDINNFIVKVRKNVTVKVIFCSGFYGGYSSAETENAIKQLQNDKASKSNVFSRNYINDMETKLENKAQYSCSENMFRNSAFMRGYDYELENYSSNILDNEGNTTKFTSNDNFIAFPYVCDTSKNSIRCKSSKSGEKRLVAKTKQIFPLMIANNWYTLSYKMRSYSGVNASSMNSNGLVYKDENGQYIERQFKDMNNYSFGVEDCGKGYWIIKTTFVADATYTNFSLVIGADNLNTTVEYTGWGITEIMFQRGRQAGAWHPHISEIYHTGKGLSLDETGLELQMTNGNNFIANKNEWSLTHSTKGTKTIFDEDGLQWEKGDLKSHYLTSVYAGYFTVSKSQNNKNLWIQLPDEFKGKDFDIRVTFKGFDLGYGASSFVLDRMSINCMEIDTVNGRFQFLGDCRVYSINTPTNIQPIAFNVGYMAIG